MMAWAGTLGEALCPTLSHGTPEQPDGLEAGLDEVRQLASALDVPVPAGVDADVASIASMLARPGPWVAFCPSDSCPDNNRVLPNGSVRLFDFEGVGGGTRLSKPPTAGRRSARAGVRPGCPTK